MKKVFSILIKILRIIFIVFITIYLLFVIIHRVSLKNSIFGYRIFSITDNTMADKYVINDLILVKDVKSNNLKKKDIIAYYGNNSFDKKKIVFHKIIEVKKDKNLSFVTKGINSLYDDPIVEDKYVIGKVIGIIPIINIFNHILKNPIGFSLLIFLPIILIILGEIFKVIKEIHREKEMIVLGMIEDKKKKKKSILEQDDGEIEIL